MSDLADAIAMLERAVSRLEAAPAEPAAQQRRIVRLAGELTARIDAAVARIDKLLDEGG